MGFRTRFAPSPTGPLHLGHAYSAIIAHDMARKNQGQFLLRLEDTDIARSKPQWSALIYEDLEWLGLSWDEPALSQAAQLSSYNPALDQLEKLNLLYPCSCTRADIRAALSAPQEGAPHDVYPQTCKSRHMNDRLKGDALRLHLNKALQRLPDHISFHEEGPIYKGEHHIDAQHALQTIGDIVVSRKGDEIIAYFLASALDDIHQGITHVVRGADLFEFTSIQVILLSLLGHKPPIYHHHDLIRDENGKRLAKRDDAKAIRKYRDEELSPHDIRVILGLVVV